MIATYSLGKPAAPIVGVDKIVARILRGLSEGGSSAVVGGSRMGKTSLLRRIKEATVKAVAFDVRGSTGCDPKAFYRHAVAALSQSDSPGATFDTFTDALRDADGPAVLLLDNLDCFPQDSEVYHQLSSLRRSGLAHRIQIVATGGRRMRGLVSAGSALEHMREEQLRALSFEECCDLIEFGFPGTSIHAAHRFYRLIGGHPYMLAVLLEECMTRSIGLDRVCDHLDDFKVLLAPRFEHWYSEMTALEREVLNRIISASPDVTGISRLREAWPRRVLIPEIEEAVRSLRCSGLIDHTGAQELSAPGALFCRWLRERPAQRDGVPKVFVVHGRNHEKRDLLLSVLRSLGCEPLTWEHAISLTGRPSPSVLEVVRAGFRAAQAVVVLLTPDDQGRVDSEWLLPHDSNFESKLSPQPRQNVLIEAGMALALFEDRTILVQSGAVRPASDLAGKVVLPFDDSERSGALLGDALVNCGCLGRPVGARHNG